MNERDDKMTQLMKVSRERENTLLLMSRHTKGDVLGHWRQSDCQSIYCIALQVFKN